MLRRPTISGALRLACVALVFGSVSCGDDSSATTTDTVGPATASGTANEATGSGSTGPSSTLGTSTSSAGGSTGSTMTTATTMDTGGSSSSGETDTDGPPLWRSELYPEDWTPEHGDDEGRFLHDFSYAGYRGGGVELGQDLPELIIDAVVDHGADPSGEADSSAALQAAIDAAKMAGGGIVELPSGLYRLDTPLVVSASNIVLRGEGAEQSRLWMTSSEGMSNKSHITFRGDLAYGDPLALSVDAPSRGHTLEVADASGLAPGDDVVVGWTITDEFIDEHAMTGVWMAFNGTWQPIFWRTVVAVDTAADPDVITLDVPLRYPAKIRDQASVRTVSGALREVGVEALGVADAVSWELAWESDQIHAIEFYGVVDGWMRGIASFPSPGAPTQGLGIDRHLQSGGLIVRQSKRVTVADSEMAWPENRGGGGNGYLFEVRQSSEVLFRDLLGASGRHNFIQNWGFGASGIVWLRIHSKDGIAVPLKGLDIGLTGYSEFHHSLATANLIDQSVMDDGWSAINRGDYSSGSGHSSTESVLWNTSGEGLLRSRQFGHGYIIGASPSLSIQTSLGGVDAEGSEPEDWVEGPGKIGSLDPPSLYEDQLARRLGR